MKENLAQAFAQAIQARRNCLANATTYASSSSFDHYRDMAERWDARIKELTECLPHGSGFDDGFKLVEERCTNVRLVFSFGFHHMDEDGCYSGWTFHTLRVYASFIGGMSMTIDGANRNGIKDSWYETLNSVFSAEAPALEFKKGAQS